jgi:hypothetical protein
LALGNSMSLALPESAIEGRRGSGSYPAKNYQWVAKDPGAFAHNGKYILQVLYDSLQDLGPASVA